MEKHDVLSRLREIQRLKNTFGNAAIDSIETVRQPKATYKQGISVIIPTYKGEDVIQACLESLGKQSLDQALFDVIIIMNGEKDATEEVVRAFMEKTKMDNITLLYSDKANAPTARNTGIEQADREYTFFLDDDDYISENFLEEMYRYASFDTVAISQIADVGLDGHVNFQNAINKQIIKGAESNNPDYQSLNMVATINACKLVPTDALKNLRYETELKSGEDVVFFTELFVKNELACKVVPIEKQVTYFRVLRKDSVSRQRMTFDFHVRQRLEVISCLDRLIPETFNPKKKLFIKQKMSAQAMFLNRYLKQNPQDRDNVRDEIEKRKLSHFPYDTMNKDLAKRLVIAYCFPPYADTSGNVMAKRLRNMNEVADVVYNKMDKVRDKDFSLNGLVDDLIEERIEVPSYPSFSNWKAIEDFCKSGMDRINQDKEYKEVYSRAMWPGSHFLAYAYKIKHPEVKWVAEFSDPLLLDIHGKTRTAKIDNEDFIKDVNKLIKKKHKLSPIKDKNLFFWCECLPYLFADELIFTNEHQLTYMVDTFPVKAIRKIIQEKAVISPQPTLPKEYYHKSESTYSLDADKANIAYFGTFYQTRNLDDLFMGLAQMDRELRKQIVLHIFTSNPAELKKDLQGSEFEALVKVNPYVGYTEFLNLTTKFDCLVVNDAHTKDSKPLNPYLPSKLSDYIGSGTSVWGIYEENSILSSCPITFRSELGKIGQAADVFEQIAALKNKSQIQINDSKAI